MRDLSHSNYAVNDFREWQADYAAHNIPTFPVGPDKRPMVRHYSKFGLIGSTKIASKFADATAIGFMCGKRSGITVLDVDSKDERILADAVSRHGQTPIVARSGSGNFQAWYRHAGERRLIRPRPDVPIDILGAGFVVGPPSEVTKGRYEFIQGSLDDLSILPTLIDAPALVPAEAPADWGSMRTGAGRNVALFRRTARGAHHCDDFDQLLDYAQTQNDQFGEPMPDTEVVKVAKSVWKMQSRRPQSVWAARGLCAAGFKSEAGPLQSRRLCALWGAQSRERTRQHFLYREWYGRDCHQFRMAQAKASTEANS